MIVATMTAGAIMATMTAGAIMAAMTAGAIMAAIKVRTMVYLKLNQPNPIRAGAATTAATIPWRKSTGYPQLFV
jgi:hypothetical protein